MLIPCPEPCVVCAPPPPGTENLGIFPNPNDPNNPFANLSSEGPDRPLFPGLNYDGGGPNNDGPSIGDPWTATGCIGTCISNVSQEAADLCAANQKVICDSFNDPQYPFCVMYPASSQCNHPGQPPDPCVVNPSLPQCKPAPKQIFYNEQTSCSQSCGDGNSSSITVPARTFSAFNQVTANLMAQTYACNLVQGLRLCLGNLSSSVTCIGQSFTVMIVASYNANLEPVNLTFEIAHGLPPGMAMFQNSPSSIAIVGSPTTGGDFTFTLTCASALGPLISKQYTIRVKGIATPSPLPDATSGTAYSKFLAVSGPIVGSVVWTLSAGSLPPGLGLDPDTGEIFGTPTDENSTSYAFIITETDQQASCSKQFTLTVNQAETCPNWANLAWDPPSITTIGSGVVNPLIIGGGIDITTSVLNEDTDVASITDVGYVTYNGPGCNGNFHYDAVVVQTNGAAGWTFQLLNVTDALVVFTTNTLVTGTFDVPFVIPDTLGLPKQYALLLSGGCGGGGGNPVPAQADVSATISNLP